MTGLSEQEAFELFARCIIEVAGPRSEVSRDMSKAVRSGEIVDMMLAQSSFDALPPETRKQIADQVEALVAQHMAGEIDVADPEGGGVSSK
ncbi:MAG: hypothetical protein HQ481_21865 [Alphaproteobacteria bacterium]|nr:hypothetical protein [Alphaproteobacteria bacterium]